MRETKFESRALWLVVGLLAGLGVASFWPHEEAFAIATDRSDQYAIMTVNVGLIDPIEGVFVLDFLTHTLKGAILNRQIRKFTAFYERNLTADFKIDPKKDAHYTMMTGQATLAGGGGVTFAPSVIYVAELNSGWLQCYTFGWQESNRLTKSPLIPVDGFFFREPDQ